jgi:hypothetical protein
VFAACSVSADLTAGIGSDLALGHKELFPGDIAVKVQNMR